MGTTEDPTRACPCPEPRPQHVTTSGQEAQSGEGPVGNNALPTGTAKAAVGLGHGSEAAVRARTWPGLQQREKLSEPDRCGWAGRSGNGRLEALLRPVCFQHLPLDNGRSYPGILHMKQ